MDKTRAHPPTRLHLRITPTAEWKLRSGHPWLYSDSILEQNREGQLGELAVIYDRYNNFLAIGLFDPDSPLRVRVLLLGKAQTIEKAWWQARFVATLHRREGLFDARTTGYRLINGESDGWPGLVLDRYDTTLVLKLYTAAWLPRLAEIADLSHPYVFSGVRPSPGAATLEKPLVIESSTALVNAEQAAPGDGRTPLSRHSIGAGNPARLILRLSRNIQSVARRQFDLTEGQILRGPALDGPVTFLETGLRFEADVVRGQKTGFFLDQRENRRLVESLAQGRHVLNAFSFSGGFSLYAARGGAAAVTDLDISEHALESARRNWALNLHNPAVAACRHQTVQADAFEWLKKHDQPEFDLVILDPPSLARREVERSGAIQAYGQLTSHAIACLRRGGILAAASCSAHVSATEFFEVVRQAAQKSGRRFEEIQTTGHPPDHPATFPEAHYLKCVYLRF